MKTAAWVSKHANQSFEPVQADADAEYAAIKNMMSQT